MSAYCIGVDLGGTKIASVLTDLEGKIVKHDRRATEAERGEARVFGNICASIQNVMADVDLNCIKGIGIGSPGAVHTQQGIVVDAANLGWKNFAINQALEKRFGLPCALENDANAAALGEWYFGAGRNTKDMIYITVSTGVGGGIICNGQLLHGRDDAAGEIGHMVLDANGPQCKCGNCGCWEALSSGTAIAAAARRQVEAGRPSSILAKAQNQPALINARMVAEAAVEQDALAIEVMERAIYYLGIGVANLIQIFNPEKIVIGGGVSKVGKILFEGVWRVVVANTFAHTIKDLTIVPPDLGDECGTIGAAALAIQYFGK